MRSNQEQLGYQEARKLSYFFHRQLWHLLAVLILVPITWSFAAPVMGDGFFLSIADTIWFWLAVGMAIVHQVIVWFVFRLQLGWAIFSRIFGRADLFVWGLLFLPLLIARPFLVFCLAYSTQNSLLLSRPIAITLALILLVPAVYTLWSVIRYFGLTRAMGADHFRMVYRHMPFVDQGAFKYSGNAMYTFAFLSLWSIALLLGSQVALFQHTYIWVHYFCTEEPNMRIIYRDKA